jgi:hypothetical protein
MDGVFKPMSHEAQRESRAAYRQFLHDRDGTPDYGRRTLSRRETEMERFTQPPKSVRAIDRALFDAQYARFDKKRPTSPEVLLLLTLTKLNAAEAYGVDNTFDAARRRAAAGEDDIESVLLVEETYHTRILLSSAVLYGIVIETPFTPTAALRTLIGGIASLPSSMARPLTMASEVMGTVAFTSVLMYAHKHLKHAPELRDAIEERIIEVLIDEVGHVSFNRFSLGAMGLAQARILLPIMARGLGGALPELKVLDAMPSDPGAVIQTMNLPEAVMKRAFLC